MTAAQTCPLQISLSHTNIHSIFSLLLLIYQPEICSHITTLLLTEISNILFAHPTNIHGMFKMRQPPYQVLPVMPTIKSGVKVIPRVIRTSSFFFCSLVWQKTHQRIWFKFQLDPHFYFSRQMCHYQNTASHITSLNFTRSLFHSPNTNKCQLFQICISGSRDQIEFCSC